MSNEMSPSEACCFFRLEVSGGFLLLLTVSAFLCGPGMPAAAALAAAVHELGHLALILGQGSMPCRLVLGFSGASLYCRYPQPSVKQEFLRALAGPAAGLALWAALRGTESGFLRLCGNMSMMLSLVNLLPAAGLDGDRILGCLLPQLLSAEQWEKLSIRLGFFSALLALCLGILHSPQLFLYGLWLLLRQLRVRI